MTNQEERNLLFENFLNRYFFYNFKTKNGRAKMLEIFVRGVCPSNCAYCYLIKHSKELYPSNCQSNERLIHNMNIIMNWYVENQFNCDISLFSGEMITDGLAFKLLDIIYEKLSVEGLENKPETIIYPENGDFLENEELMGKVQEYYDKFKAIGIRLMFSLSVDGKYMDENRSRKHDEEYYKRIMKFAAKNYFAFHPMVSAFNIDKWIKNYDWWMSDEVPKAVSDRIMTLEVRDNNWTNDKIDEYLKFLNHVIDFEFEKVHQDKDIFSQRILGTDNYPAKGYDIIRLFNFLFQNNENDRSGLGCSVQSALCVRLGDLTIHPCHRLAYKQFQAGSFKVEDNKIVGFNCDNWEILSSIYSWNRTSTPKCSDCDFRFFCCGPCLGSNFETTGDMFFTGDTVCNLFKAKITFLVIKYEELGLIEYFKKYMPHNEFQALENFMKKTKERFSKYGQYARNQLISGEKAGVPAGEYLS